MREREADAADFKYSKMAASGANKQAIDKWKVPELKAYLQCRGITVSQKRKDELIYVAEKARDLSLEPMDDGEKPEQVIRNKLQLDNGLLPCPNTFAVRLDMRFFRSRGFEVIQII